MSINNQTVYWNKVAHSKTFTHPVDLNLLNQYIANDSLIIDFGCGYGRVVRALNDAGFPSVKGFDTSSELVARGKGEGVENIFCIESPAELPVENNSVDCILLFAVLTCIPGNSAQKSLLSLLRNKLKPGGIIYISDYYLQSNSAEMKEYVYLNDDPENYGVFHLEEGVTFRHHTREWIRSLVNSFTIISEQTVGVKTMNGSNALAFQMIIRK